MFLKSLEIQGFKSFPDKITLQLGSGLTAVVGPNGSGKSNISDAIRWVLGEQSTKSLRGAKMEDVIFSGTQSRKALSFAAVSLVFDNKDQSLPVQSEEVVITRKYYRSGESEYQINRQNVRLKDVYELMMDTGLGKDGYSIIGQGKVAEIVSSKSTERREIFEEAAGISKFKYRKNEASRKLALAQENLLRLKDILTELEDRVGPLKEQSEKAQEYLKYAEEKKTLEVSLWMDTLKKSNEKVRSQEDKILVCTTEYEEHGKEIEALEKRQEQEFQQQNQLLAKIDQCRTQQKEKEEAIALCRSEIAVCENDVQHNLQSAQRIEGELETAKAAGENTQVEIEEKEATIAVRLAEAEAIRTRLEETQAELEALAGQADAGSEEKKAISERLSALSLELANDRVAAYSAQSSMDEVLQNKALNEENRAEQIARQEETEKELGDVRAFLKETDEKLDSCTNSITGYKLKRDNREAKAKAIEANYNQLDLKLKETKQRMELLVNLENNLEGFAGSVRFIVSQGKKGALRGIIGPVSKLLSVGEEYATAVETALGGALQHIVVEDEDAAKRAIGELKRSGAGRATFLPLTAIKGRTLNETGLDRVDGFVGVASELVGYEPRFRGIMENLLGRIVVVDDIDTAVRMAKKYSYRFRIVTLDGQLVNVGGSLTGGTRVKSSGVLGRDSQIEKLRVSVTSLTEELASLGKKRDALHSELDGLRANVSVIESEIMTHTEDKIRYEAEQRRLTMQLSHGEETLEKLATLGKEYEKRLAELAQTKKEKELRLGQLGQEIAALNEELEAHSRTTQGFAEKRQEYSDLISQMKMELLTVEKEIEGIRALAEQLRGALDSGAEKEQSLQNQLVELEGVNASIHAQITVKEGEIERFNSEISAIQKEIETINATRQAFEKNATAIRASIKEHTAQRDVLGRELARLEERRAALEGEYDSIIARLWEEYELTKSEAMELAGPVEDEGAARRRVKELKSRMKALGNVNISAIEEYKEVSKRFGFLNTQYQDAVRSRDELIGLIGSLTGQMRELFTTSFQQINSHFSQIFVELFGGGKAELTLSDAENVLESGIDIHVQPPGKIINNLASLSGGEQAMVAIAIYFAILKVRPAPFCILDEIDAPLDDVNVGKYAAYLRKMSENTQFIIITHRRGSMEEADVLYGVTMQQQGVSKLLQLKVSEVEQKLGLKRV